MLSQKKADKSDMDETIEESRELRRKLIDTQMNLATVRSEMEKLRSEYEIKCEQFNNKYVVPLYTIIKKKKKTEKNRDILRELPVIERKQIFCLHWFRVSFIIPIYRRGVI